MKPNRGCYRGYRFPPEIISPGVWLYHRFFLSFQDVEELLAERGIVVSYETIRQAGASAGAPGPCCQSRTEGRRGVEPTFGAHVPLGSQGSGND